jgi:hypothetical protein
MRHRRPPRRLALLGLALGLALGLGALGAGRALAEPRQLRRFQPHRSDTRLRPGMILRSRQDRSRLEIRIRPARGRGAARLEQALVGARGLAGKSGFDAALDRLVKLTVDIFPRGDATREQAYLGRVERAARHGRSVSLASLAGEDLASCRERAATLKMLLDEAGIPRARLRVGASYASPGATPVGHAWVELPLENGDVLVVDPSRPREEAVARVKPSRGWVVVDGTPRLRPVYAVGDRTLVVDDALERGSEPVGNERRNR